MVNYENDASDRDINLSTASDCIAVFGTLLCLLLEQQEHSHTFDSVPHRAYVGHSPMCTALDSWFHAVLNKAALLSLLLWFSNIRSAECYHIALLILKKIFSYYWAILIHPLLVICPTLKGGVSLSSRKACTQLEHYPVHYRWDMGQLEVPCHRLLSDEKLWSPFMRVYLINHSCCTSF